MHYHLNCIQNLICHSFVIFVANTFQDLMYGSQVPSWACLTKWRQGREWSTMWNTHQNMRRNLQRRNFYLRKTMTIILKQNKGEQWHKRKFYELILPNGECFWVSVWTRKYHLKPTWSMHQPAIDGFDSVGYLGVQETYKSCLIFYMLEENLRTRRWQKSTQDMALQW